MMILQKEHSYMYYIKSQLRHEDSSKNQLTLDAGITNQVK